MVVTDLALEALGDKIQGVVDVLTLRVSTVRLAGGGRHGLDPMDPALAEKILTDEINRLEAELAAARAMIERAGIVETVIDDSGRRARTRYALKGELANKLARDFGDALVQATELTSEMLASACELPAGLEQLHQTLWQMRWELGLPGVSSRVDEDGVRALATVHTPAQFGGAS